MFKKQIQSYVPMNEQEVQDQKVILNYIKLFEHNILTRENEFAHLTSSGFILNEARDKVLMIYHNIYQSWAWTGGHADGDCDLLHVAIKEAKEETGLDINELRLLGTTSGKNCFIEFPHGDKAFFITIGYVCKSYSGKLSIDNFETKDLRFFGYNELPENIPRSHKVFIEQYYNL